MIFISKTWPRPLRIAMSTPLTLPVMVYDSAVLVAGGFRRAPLFGPSECLAVGVAQTHSLCLRLVALGHGGADAGVPAVVADGDEDLPSCVVQATVRDPRSNGFAVDGDAASPPSR